MNIHEHLVVQKNTQFQYMENNSKNHIQFKDQGED